MRLSIALAAVLLAAAAGCSGSSDPAQRVTVFAASSLRAAFEELAGEFEAGEPGTDVVLNLAGSRDLVAQLSDGAAADVLATADIATMAAALAEGVVAGEPREFATNRLAVAVPVDNPAGVTGVGDLSAPGLRLVVCAPQVPCGAAAGQLRTNLGMIWRPVSEENSVAGVMGKVLAGEADAGIVYTTDLAAAAGLAAGVEVPDAVNVTTTYPIAAVRPGSDAAERFIAFVTGQQGRSILARGGFGAP